MTTIHIYLNNKTSDKKITKDSPSSEAYSLGVSFAKELNSTPREAMNWRKMTSGSDIPDEDYLKLERKFGEFTKEMEREYIRGFNSVFKPIGK